MSIEGLKGELRREGRYDFQGRPGTTIPRHPKPGLRDIYEAIWSLPVVAELMGVDAPRRPSI